MSAQKEDLGIVWCFRWIFVHTTLRHVRIRRPLASVWIRLYVWTVRKRVAPHHTDHWGLLQQKCTVTHTHTAQQSTLFKTRSISADCSLWNCTLPRTVGHGWSLQLLGGHANDPMMGLGQCDFPYCGPFSGAA